MPSSISSSDAITGTAPVDAPVESPARPGFVRKTASDRPGVAQPVPERDIPDRPWSRIMLLALLVFLTAMAAWEWHWREFGAAPSYRNSDSEWAAQRRRIDTGEGDATVLTGASRVLFDVQLPVWESLTAERPIQLAMEVTSPITIVEDLAVDPDFKGRLLVGVAPDVFFSGFAYRGSVLPYYKKEGPSQRSGSIISKVALEPYFAFYDPDFALNTVVRRMDWPLRPGMKKSTRVRKLMVQQSDRNSRMWHKVADDPAYRALARSIWAEDFSAMPPFMDTVEKRQKIYDEQISKASAAVAKLRARGVPVVFVRLPSDGAYYDFEQKYFPRDKTWDLLLSKTGAPGIHFEDHPQLQGYELPEWSHLSAPEADRLTAALVPLVEAEFARQAAN